MIDIEKVVKGDLMLVKKAVGQGYRVGEVISVRKKNKRLSFRYGDYGSSYYVSIEDCKPYECATYKPSYLRGESK